MNFEIIIFKKAIGTKKKNEQDRIQLRDENILL